MSTNPNLTSLDDLSAEEHGRYTTDDEFRSSVDALINKNKNARRGSTTQEEVRTSGGVVETGGKTVVQKARQKPYVSSRYPETESNLLIAAMGKATASKVRELSPAESLVAFAGLCDDLGVPEQQSERMKFHFDIIAWITLNTASTENGIDSIVGEKYSAVRMLDYFDKDIRPYARSVAKDAKTFITYVMDNNDHALHDSFGNLARKYGVAKTPWLIYDGIDAAKITESESRIADDIKFARLSGGGRTPGPAKFRRGASDRSRDRDD